MMLERAFQSKPPVVQIATWNDWGEGTQIEPSHEFGNRDLETIQALRRRHVDSQFAHQPDDLRLPRRLLEARRQPNADAGRLNNIATAIAAGDLETARQALDEIENESS